MFIRFDRFLQLNTAVNKFDIKNIDNPTTRKIRVVQQEGNQHYESDFQKMC